MFNFNYYHPVKILFGVKRLNEIGDTAANFGKRCLLVTTSDFPSSHIIKTKKVLLAKGLKVEHFDKVIPNPTVDIVNEGAEIAKKFKADVVIGLGGGSSIDTAKAIAVSATHPGTCWDYLYFKKTQPTSKTLPIIAIPTTSGTGSHVTQVAVVTNSNERCKSALYNSVLYPRVAIVDPELMISMPPHLTAVTGFDAFCHAFESYINPKGSPYTDLLAKEAIRIIIKNLPKAIENGENIEVRTQMAWADTLAGLSIANAGVTLPHGIAMAIGGLYPHVAHGEALASVYPAIMRFTWKYAKEKFAFLWKLFEPKENLPSINLEAYQACNALENFLKAIGLHKNLKNLGVSEDELDLLAKRSLTLPDYKNHPYIVNLKQVRELINQSYES